MRIQYVARLILQTPISGLINSTLAAQFMSTLNEMLSQERMLFVGNADAEELLTRLIIIFAPVARLAESLVCKLAYLDDNYYWNNQFPAKWSFSRL